MTLLNILLGRCRPPQVRVDDRTGLLRAWELNDLGGWAGVDFGDHRLLWFPADQVTLVGSGGRGGLAAVLA
jgi:hypothetical protein